MPVLSGIYKSTGHAISLVIRDKMKIFNGFRELLLMQDCISAVKYESDVKLDDTYNTMSLVNTFDLDPNRPWETVRLDTDFRRRYNIDYTVDDNFELQVPDVDINPEKFYVGDRQFHNEMDQRRQFNVLQSSGKFPLDKCEFLDYNTPMHINAGILKKTNKPIFSTFTGISIIADLLNKEQIVFWGDDLKNWDGKPIDYSFNKHFYRNRKTKLMYLGDFDLSHYEA